MTLLLAPLLSPVDPGVLHGGQQQARLLHTAGDALVQHLQERTAEQRRKEHTCSSSTSHLKLLYIKKTSINLTSDGKVWSITQPCLVS